MLSWLKKHLIYRANKFSFYIHQHLFYQIKGIRQIINISKNFGVGLNRSRTRED